MSENSEDFTKNHIQDGINSPIDNISEIEDESTSMFDVRENSTLLVPQESNSNISKMLQKVAELAENIREDLRNIQIGDYIVSMNMSPLELQVKQAINNIQVIDDDKKTIVTKAYDDSEHAADIPVPLKTNECDDKNTTNNTRNEVLQNSESLNLEQNDIKNIKTQKKRMNLGERLRRFFRFSSSRRKNC